MRHSATHTAVIASALIVGVTMAAATGTASAADPQLLNLVMPDAQIMAGLNVTTAKISPFGQFLLGRISSASVTGTDPGLQKFIEETGFDPRQDVTEVLMASAGDKAHPGGLVLAKGSFNVTKMVDTAKAHGKGTAVSSYAGATLFTAEAPEGAPDAAKQTPHALAFIGSSIAVAGDLPSVQAALDRSRKVNSISPALATKVQALGSTTDAWTISMASLASLIPSDLGGKGAGAAQPLQMVKNVVSSSGGVKFGSDIQITGQAVATDAPSAKAMADLVRLVGAVVTMGAAQDPQVGAAAQLIQNLKVTEDGATVNLSLTVPESQVETLIQATTSSKAKPEAIRKM